MDVGGLFSGALAQDSLLAMSAGDRLLFTLTVIGSLVGILVGVTSLWRGQQKDRHERKEAERQRIIKEEETRQTLARFLAEFKSNGGASMRDVLDRIESTHKLSQSANSAAHRAINKHLDEQIAIAHETHEALSRRIDGEAERLTRIYDIVAELVREKKPEEDS